MYSDKNIPICNNIHLIKMKWYTEFKLLGIFFDVTLSKMQVNYVKAVEAVWKEPSSWQHRFLTILKKITVIKTMCLPKLNHIVAVDQNPNLTYLQQLDAEFKSFISLHNPNVVDETTRHMARQEGGWGLPNIYNFCKAFMLT